MIHLVFSNREVRDRRSRWPSLVSSDDVLGPKNVLYLNFYFRSIHSEKFNIHSTNFRIYYNPRLSQAQSYCLYQMNQIRHANQQNNFVLSMTFHSHSYFLYVHVLSNCMYEDFQLDLVLGNTNIVLL